MIISEDKGVGKYQIKAYASGQVTINNVVHANSLIISHHQLLTDWPVHNINDISDDHLSAIISLKPAIVLLGTGDNFQLPQQKQLAILYGNRIGVEVMDTGAACRTFMALTAEGRNVVAALIIH